MGQTKIQFSQAERSLMQDAGVILTKNKVIRKVVSMFAGLQDVWTETECNGKQSSFATGPKISKGENYNGLPYVILDYPRQFEGKNIMAVRTMFWWGNFYSVTLHLSGEKKQAAKECIINAYDMLCANNFYIGVHEDQWQHHFNNDNYIPVLTLDQPAFSEHCNRHEHLKIAKYWPLSEMESFLNEIRPCWKLLVELI